MSEPIGRRRGRPRGDEGAALLDAARTLMLESGFDGTTMAMVAARARVSKASLYREHPSKDALYAAVVGDWVARGTDAMRPIVDGLVAERGTPDALARFGRVLQRAVTSREVLGMRLLVGAQASRHPEVAEAYLRDSWDRNIAMLGDGFRRLQQAGVLTSGDPADMAAQFTWLVLAEPLNAHALGAGPLPARRLDRIVDEAVATFRARFAAGAPPTRDAV